LAHDLQTELVGNVLPECGELHRGTQRYGSRE
jgi:hypothetical protein